MLAGCATFVIQFYLGLKRKIPAVPLALALTGSLLMFIIFMKAPFFRMGLSESEIASVRYMMTGGLGTVVGVLTARYILKIGFDRLDDAALVFPLAVGLTKIGCFFAGCCFGIPGGGVLGVSYGEVVPAFVFYLDHESHFGHTPVLHPVQLYEAAGAFLILVLMVIMRRSWKQPGSAFFFLIVAYLPVRIGAEFYRASDIAIVWNGLKSVQIISFVLWIVALVLWRRNERSTFFMRQVPVTNSTVLISYFIIEVILFLILSGYLHFIERSVIVVALVFTGFVIFRQRPRFSVLQLRRVFVLPASIVVILISTAQVSLDTVRYKSVHFGVSTGKYINTYRDQDGCGALTKDYEQHYTMWGAGFSSNVKRGRQWSELGVTAFGGQQSETGLDATTAGKTYFYTFGVRGYGKYDVNWVGIGAGLSLGNLRYAEDKTDQPLGKIGYYDTPVMPSLHFRLGPRRWLYAQYDFGGAFPTSSPGYLHELSIGSGFGKDNGFAIRFGGEVGHYGTFLNATIPWEHFTLDANYVFGNTYAGTPQVNKDVSQFRFSIKYHLSPKEKPNDR